MDKSIAIYCYVNRCNGCNPAKVTAEDRRTINKATATMAEAAIQPMIINSRLSRRGRMSWCSRCRPPLTLVLARYRLGSISHLQTTWGPCCRRAGRRQTLSTEVGAISFTAQVLIRDYDFQNEGIDFGHRRQGMGLSDKSSVSAKRGETGTVIIFATATRF